MTTPEPRRAAMAFIVVTLFLDVLGFGIIIPVLPHLVTTLSGGDASRGASSFGRKGPRVAFAFSGTVPLVIEALREVLDDGVLYGRQNRFLALFRVEFVQAVLRNGQSGAVPIPAGRSRGHSARANGTMPFLVRGGGRVVILAPPSPGAPFAPPRFRRTAPRRTRQWGC